MTPKAVRIWVLAAAVSGMTCDGSGPVMRVATSLAFQNQPVAAVKDTAMPGNVRVAVLDQNGDVLTTAAATVTLAIGTNPGTATLGGTVSQPATAGVATFTGLTLNAVGTGYTLVASATGLSNATSSTFNVTLSLTDFDGDTFSPNAGDCDDNAASIHPNATDLPEPGFVDSNCDGIDGDESKAVFVSTAGTDVSNLVCSKAAPCRTIDYAAGVAVTLARRDEYVAAGTYAGGMTLRSGVSVYGGYTNTWTRNASFGTIVTGGFRAAESQYLTVLGDNLTQTVVLADLRVVGPNATGTVGGVGQSSHGIVLRNVNPGIVTLTRLEILAGSGADGLDGTNGSDGSGTPAPEGSAGGDADSLLAACDNSTRGAGGAAGTQILVTGRNPNGGAGGPGGTIDTDCSGFPLDWDLTARAGTAGTNAAVSFVGLYGTGGTAGSGANSCGFPGNGLPGDVQNGSAGSGAGSAGRLISNYWYGKDGNDGGLGDNGTGGGGGGGSGGCDIGVDEHGAGGGGGGAGGARAGSIATGGKGAGGSFGIYLISASPTISSSSIQRGAAGAGGAGGRGGRGQSGGLGAPGGLGDGDAKAGGRGGDGAHGGHGGGGGGGAGGISVGIYRSSAVSNPATSGLSFSGGTAGQGGQGGQSAPLAPAAERDGNNGFSGANGSVGTTVVCAAAGGC